MRRKLTFGGGGGRGDKNVLGERGFTEGGIFPGGGDEQIFGWDFPTIPPSRETFDG